MAFLKFCCLLLLIFLTSSSGQGIGRKLGKFQEVFAWKQITYDIFGNILTADRDSPIDRSSYRMDDEEVWDWNTNVPSNSNPAGNSGNRGTTGNNGGDANRFFIQYNNLPMGAERVGNRVFIALPRRRYGIPSTLNYINLDSTTQRSPHLKPYPDIERAKEVTSIYRTRADKCGRLWAVDTGRLELPGTQIQVTPPAIVIYDLKTNRLIHRYQFKASDLPAENTPTGLASITVDITDNDCADAYAYIPDLTTFGMIVYSLKQNDSWRHSHNYYGFDPTAGNLYVADQRFQWSDGVFSVTLLPFNEQCKLAYFHSLIGTHEFSVSTCLLKNRTAATDSNYHLRYSIVGNRGEMTQSTMHDYHPGSNVVFYAEIGRDAVTCWNAAEVLRSTNVAVLARDTSRLSYPSDLHVTDNEVWVIANKLPRFGYSRYNTNEYNFYVYRANVQDLIANTVCASTRLAN